MATLILQSLLEEDAERLSTVENLLSIFNQFVGEQPLKELDLNSMNFSGLESSNGTISPETVNDLIETVIFWNRMRRYRELVDICMGYVEKSSKSLNHLAFHISKGIHRELPPELREMNGA